NLEEVLTIEDLRKMLEEKAKLNHYIGFEISGKIHLGSGLATSLKIKDFVEAGVNCSVFLADWHTWINDKLGGDKEFISRMAVGYFKEGFKALFKTLKIDEEKVKFVLGSDLYHNNDAYWETLIDVSKHTSLSRIGRSITIMGRKEGENIDFAKLLYPPMQVADIFVQELNLPHAGMDQRKAQVIARDVALKLRKPLTVKGKPVKPVALHGHLILGLQKPRVWPVSKEKMQEAWSEIKMSKSVPNSAVFIHDSEEEIEQKLNKAFCPEKEVEFNPVLDWTKHLLFAKEGFELNVRRPDKFGGNVSFNEFRELEETFRQGKLHPLDLKKAVSEELINVLEPVRKHFSKGKPFEMKKEMEKASITR
ncbi:MAG: tyrosine--tRNA ligase, partial [archaeon]